MIGEQGPRASNLKLVDGVYDELGGILFPLEDARESALRAFSCLDSLEANSIINVTETQRNEAQQGIETICQNYWLKAAHHKRQSTGLFRAEARKIISAAKRLRDAIETANHAALIFSRFASSVKPLPGDRDELIKWLATLEHLEIPSGSGRGSRQKDHIAYAVWQLVDLWTVLTGLPFSKTFTMADGHRKIKEFVQPNMEFVSQLMHAIDPTVLPGQVVTALRSKRPKGSGIVRK